jgi:hypothetical protein
VAARDERFLVAWASFGSSGSDTEGTSIQGQLYAADGSPIGGEFQVNDHTLGYQYGAGVAADGDGGFIVVWSSSSAPAPDTDGFAVFGRRVSADDARLGDEFVVNSYTTEDQAAPSVSLDGAGGFVVAWQSEGSSGTDASGLSVQARRFSAALFADGFESGDTSAWSTTVP